MAQTFIGKQISLISHSDVRYRGILAGIDPAASTIQLSNVYSMGTESRRPPAEFIPPVQEPYQYIIFRASEVKDLAVDEPTPRRNVHDDPAVLGASAPTTNPPYQAYPAPAPVVAVPQQPPQPPPLQAFHQQRQPPAAPPVVPPQLAQTPATPQPVQVQASSRPNSTKNGRGTVHTAAASLETVERALGDLRVSNNTGAQRGGRRGQAARGGRQDAEQIKVPATDFDFESSNAKFDKAALSPSPKEEVSADAGTSAEGDAVDKEKSTEKEKVVAYNPQKSFFDSLSSSTASLPPSGPSGNGGRGRRGGGIGRNRREEERERNVATFGEPGGVGLMGPGAYVGGWGGYGRRGRGARRGGRGGAGGSDGQTHAVPARG